MSAGAHNALELIRLGRLAPRSDTPYEVFHRGEIYSLRRYAPSGARDGAAAPQRGGPLLLIPPLMLTAEIYDVAPDLSAVATLRAAGVDTWVIDFGAPETVEGGMSRTIDDHIRAIADAVARVRAATGSPVHLAGYSQGGMFAYQTAGYLRCEGLASVITFGSPVDIHANARFATGLAERLATSARKLLELPLEHVEGIPGLLNSVGFKLLTPGKELMQLVDFVSKLHDRQALERRENRRRFLGGEGFVAWPGPALRQFVDEFVVHNRLMSGGLVIDGRSVTLADISVPVLCFIGWRDEFARPRAVKAVRRAAPKAEISEVMLQAGHFGLVVGRLSLLETWPTVAEWVRWQAGAGPRPRLLAAASAEAPARVEPESDDELGGFEPELDVELFYDTAARAAKSLWKQVGEWSNDAAQALDGLRWQLPRLARLRLLQPQSRISMAQQLARQAARHPTETFFLWSGRAFSYRDADLRVDNVARGLIASGVKPGMRVGVLMKPRPSFLSVVTALNRLGAVAVLLEPSVEAQAIRRALELAETSTLVADPEHAAAGFEALGAEVLVLGGEGAGNPRVIPSGCRDLERIEPAEVPLPEWYRPNPGRASDLAMIVFTSGRFERARASRITNRRWAFAAYGAAAAATLTRRDTVYSCLPLHHPSGILVSIGAALVGGSRIALATELTPESFWDEVRRYGATVAFYAGEVFRGLADAPPDPTEHVNPLRLFAGSGLRKDVWRRLRARFGAAVLEFYASTEGSLVLANASGEKVGAIGRPLPGSAEVAVARYDFAAQDFSRDSAGYFIRCGAGEPGVLISRIDPAHPSSAFEGVREHRGMSRVRGDAFEPGDHWFVTGDVVRQDADGDYWLIDRAADMIPAEGGYVSSRVIEDAVYEVPGVRLAVAYGLPGLRGAGETVAVALVLAEGVALDLDAFRRIVTAELRDGERPRVLRLVREIPMTAGFRPMKSALRSAGLAGDAPTYLFDLELGRYVARAPGEAAREPDPLRLPIEGS